MVKETNVSFNSGRVKIAGTLATPNKKTETCILLVAGSGMQDRDETFGEQNGTFKDISDFLVKEGFAVLRYDKRGCFKSKGNYKRSTLYDFTKDAKFAVKYLSKKYDKIFVLGHSEGGLIATLVASQINIKGLILLASANEPIEKMVENQLQTMHKMFPEQVTNQILNENKQWKSDIKKGIYKNYSDYYSKKSKLQDWIKQANKQNPQSPQYWNSSFELDIQNKIKKVSVPILILNGKMDFMVDYKKAQKLFDIVKKVNSKSTLKLFDTLCHRFVPVKDLKEGLSVDTGALWDTRLDFNKKALNFISKWIKDTAKLSP